MKIFFAASSAASTEQKKCYKVVMNSIRNSNQILLDSWIVKLLDGRATVSSQKDILLQQQTLVRSADCLIVECQYPSFGIGFLMHQAIQERKPILCLYPEGLEADDLSDMIAGNSSSLVLLRQYNDHNIDSVINEFLNHYRSDDLHKFNFIASREVLEYIEEGSKNTGKSKSEFLRDEITKIIRSS